MKLHYLVPFFFLFACSSSNDAGPVTTPCNEDPWQCPTGQTCWPTDLSGTFACLNSAAGKVKGDACGNTVGAPTCGDGLACFQGVGDASGHCVAYCDNTKAGHGCAAGETCQTALLSGTSSAFHICVGGSTMMDSGTDSTPSETGSDTGSATDGASDSSSADSGSATDAAGETATDAASGG
ncbi:MAG: hypothetical protein ACXWP4_26570 [Polyangiales bacterium]